MSRFSHLKENTDYLNINVNEIYKKFPINRKIKPKPNQVNFNRSIFHRIYRTHLLPLKLRIAFWYLFRRINLNLTWFKEFSEYGNRVLFKERKLLYPLDLFFFKNFLGILSNKLKFPITDDPYVHLEARQIPEINYSIFYLISKENYFFYYNI